MSLLELRNVSFFYTVQILLQEKLVNRNNFGLYFDRTKLSKKIILKKKCWLYQIRLVYTRKYFISCANLPKKGLILQKCVFSQTVCTDLHTDISATSMKFCNSGLYLFVILVFYLLIIVCFLYFYLFLICLLCLFIFVSHLFVIFVHICFICLCT